jgi:hypothetical protein
MQDKTDTRTRAARAAEGLPYRIELRRADAANEVERVLARAATVQLARAIFKAAQVEHPQRRVVLSKGTRVVGDSAE